MNVRELIEELQKIEDQELPVEFFYFDCGANVSEVVESVGFSNTWKSPDKAIVMLRGY